jgi:hypothetical protein
LTLKQLNAGRPDTVGGLPSSSGGPHDYGRVGDAMLADADPLGVNVNVTFDEVGGLDERAFRCCFSFYHRSSFLCFDRYTLAERDDSTPSFVPRSLPTVWRHSSQRCSVPWTSRYW